MKADKTRVAWMHVGSQERAGVAEIMETGCRGCIAEVMEFFRMMEDLAVDPEDDETLPKERVLKRFAEMRWEEQRSMLFLARAFFYSVLTDDEERWNRVWSWFARFGDDAGDHHELPCNFIGEADGWTNPPEDYDSKFDPDDWTGGTD